ncbi:hypothetical protein BT63DRAFT_53788 [Microthyrium microscopicum]|uniref:Rhodopsin domain-containing protein n=1 Tax=Microthyrium microscopicum TaxID=703497 RepID=A0A6A6U2A5_9PEZI|nr:hypothetical protein BT63DRAFT_53788 [Microthyrium microscopicum]
MKFRHPEVMTKWPTPNFIDPVKRGPEIYFINSTFFFLATITVWIRLYTRAFIRRWFGADDVFILLAWIFGMADVATVFWGYDKFWWDRHMWDTKFSFLVPGAKTVFVCKIFWITSSTCVRISLLFLYYRLLDHMEMRNYRWAVHATMAFVVSLYLCFLGTDIFACIPIDQYWAWPPKGTCLDEGLADTILSAVNTFSEVVVAALPIPIIVRLGTYTKQKWGIIVLLCAGFLVSVVGSFRTYYVWTLFNTDDLSWWAAPHWICSEVEISVAMICASMPAIRPVIGRLLRKENPISRVIRKNRQASHERKYFQTYATTTVDSYADKFSDAQNTYSRDIDVEGIALDGLGYTVRITGGLPKPEKKHRLSRFAFSRRSRMDRDREMVLPPIVFDNSKSGGSWNWPNRASRSTRKALSMEILARHSLEVEVSGRGGGGGYPLDSQRGEHAGPDPRKSTCPGSFFFDADDDPDA